MDEGKAEVRKKCFIITPIGDNGSEIRRHIDGIIDAVLIPVLEEHFDYDLEVAHRIDAPGNIPKQVITSIFDSDLVVANLTGNNPNVMYELALRHCFGTAAIMIAEVGTKIPADIVSERTIFYVNDAQGVLELKDKLKSMVQRMHDDGKVEQSGPVYDALREERNRNDAIVKIPDSVNADAFTMVWDKLNVLQKDIRRKEFYSNEESFGKKRINANQYILMITAVDADHPHQVDRAIHDILLSFEEMKVISHGDRIGKNQALLVLSNFRHVQLSIPIIVKKIRDCFAMNDLYDVDVTEMFGKDI